MRFGRDVRGVRMDTLGPERVDESREEESVPADAVGTKGRRAGLKLLGPTAVSASSSEPYFRLASRSDIDRLISASGAADGRPRTTALPLRHLEIFRATRAPRVAVDPDGLGRFESTTARTRVGLLSLRREAKLGRVSSLGLGRVGGAGGWARRGEIGERWNGSAVGSSEGDPLGDLPLRP